MPAPSDTGRSARAMEYLIRAFFSSQLHRTVRTPTMRSTGGPREELFLLFMVGLMYTLEQFLRARKGPRAAWWSPSMSACWLRICRAVRNATS